MRDRTTSEPGVFIKLTSTDYDHAVLLTTSETEQVGQALADAARLIHRDLDRAPVLDGCGQPADLNG